MDDMEAYEPIEREPVGARFRGTEVLTNPPPSSGGILIAYALGLLERLGERSGVEQVVAATEAANSHRGDEFHEGLHSAGYQRALPRAGAARRGRRSGSRRATGWGRRRGGRARDPADGSARRPTSRRSTATGCAPR